MSHAAYAYIEKSFNARYISDFPRYGDGGPSQAISGPAGAGAAGQIGITIDTDPGLLVWINGVRISSIEVLYDATRFYVSPADLTLNPSFNVPIRREGDVGITTLFKPAQQADMREYFLTIFPYAAGSKPGAVTLLPPDVINKPAWLTMRVKGGYKETALFKKAETRRDGSGEFTFESVTRGAVY
ncbi:hypothetical protein [Nitrospirillum bahiense]|uniref:Uncharacterized protein n=1 Tax=Nitrospirillum amazonense TaxID=28077 RepID=A0A560F5I5_9PROT|nr:hypothetical protein [Nitrospirillum amazonense]TWB16794.1 hypothetical protein FBZ88_12824 [Nitrospirillum amazonense]